ncbi:hypothetical protein SASPL_105460 [Salvia splendens]|uniref:NusG-like N-terminal domain-containing protein n=1 Tax=Salvia splendens TaxID=180675 RepID=A0A8X9A9C0_SALSN|nr:hypothetical protein SASPL_105460 [Salvia splendens]
MKQGLISWSHAISISPPLLLIPRPTIPKPKFPAISVTLNSVEECPATGRERRQMRKERREGKPAYNWKEEVEMKLIKKPKKRYVSWMEELNLDNLALLGPQWWVVRVSRVSGYETAERVARLMARTFPNMEFKVCSPSVQIKRKLKNGTLSVKPKPIFPGCMFLKCVMNKEVHDFIRECDGVGGFIGSKVGNTKRQINKPRPVDEDDMEAIFKQAKEEQVKADQAFEEEQLKAEASNPENLGVDSPLVSQSIAQIKPLKKTGKDSADHQSCYFDIHLLHLWNMGSTIKNGSTPFVPKEGEFQKLKEKSDANGVGVSIHNHANFVGECIVMIVYIVV